MSGLKRIAKRTLSLAFGRDAASIGTGWLDGVDLVTFDVFDTLVVRSCGEPGRVFDVVGTLYGEEHPDNPVDDFRGLRESAERKARSAVGPSDEVTLEGIYARMPLPEAARSELMKLELAVEIAVCEPCPAVVARFSEAIAGCRVAIISDTYLPTWVVAEILSSCGIEGHERLFVSSEHGVMKRDGRLFEFALSELGAEAGRTLHVGDHPLADWIVPRRLGMRSHLLNVTQNNDRLRHIHQKEEASWKLYDSTGDETPAVSVIVPVYNSAEYLPDMLDGLLAERTVFFEVILIDDGSTDGSSEVIDAYAERDSRIVAVHQDNSGLCAARNVGLTLARGEYVTFCDNDDRVLEGFISENIHIAQEKDVDCVRFGARHLTISADGMIIREKTSCPKKRAVFRHENMVAMAKELDFGLNGVWCGLYRKRVLIENAIRFNPTFRNGFEDCLFNDAFMVCAESYALNPRVYYVWQQRNGHSASSNVTENGIKSLETLLAYERMILEESGLSQTDSRYCAQRLVNYFNGILTRSCLERGRSFSKEVKIYEMCRRIMMPYRDIVDVPGKDYTTSIIVHSIMNRRWHTLFLATWLGVNMQKAVYIARRLSDKCLASLYVHSL